MNKDQIEAHSHVLQREALAQLKSPPMRLPLPERMAVPHRPAARADIILAALISSDAVMNYANRDTVTHSFYNLRYGIAAELMP